MLIGSSMLHAQEVKTYSAYDTNLDEEVTISDVTGVTERVLRKVESDPQLMKAEDVVEALNRIYDKIDKLSINLNSLSILNGIAPSSVDGCELVDLGLPSGTLWAACDVGSTEIGVNGTYFAWAETKTKSQYNNNTYIYPKILGTPSSVPISIPEGQDAATENMGKDWQIPSIEQWEELFNSNYCTVDASATYNGIDVVSVTSKTNGNVLILCKGRAITQNYASDTYKMLYWSNAGPSSDPRRAYCVAANDKIEYINYYKFWGVCVRGVVSKSISDVIVENKPKHETETILATSVSISQSTYAMKTGEAVALTATVSPDDASDKSVVWYSNKPGVVSVNSNGVVTANGVGTAVVTVIANGGSGLSASCTITVTKAAPESGGDGIDHEYVDLGLPSGTLWATCNVGATYPAEAGNYYAWGETTTKSSYNWSTYFDALDSEGGSFKKYSLGGKTTLDPEDDVAYVAWGSDWRMPTKTEIQELIDNTNISTDGNTYVLTSQINSKKIVFPQSGYYDETSFVNATSKASRISHIWSKTLNEIFSDSAYILDMSKNEATSPFISQKYITSLYRYKGLPVRAVYVGNK